jgi:hypothetical protein
MCNNLFSDDEIRRYIETEVPLVHRALAIKALDSTLPIEVEEIGLLMAGEKAKRDSSS